MSSAHLGLGAMIPFHRHGDGISRDPQPSKGCASISISHAVTPGSDPTAGRPGLGSQSRSSNSKPIALPCILGLVIHQISVLPSAMCVSALLCFLIRRFHFLCCDTCLGHQGWNSHGSASSRGPWKQGWRLTFHSHSPFWSSQPWEVDIIVPALQARSLRSSKLRLEFNAAQAGMWAYFCWRAGAWPGNRAGFQRP